MITISIYDNDSLNKYYPYADACLLMVPGYAISYKDLNIDEAIKLCHDNNIIPILGINRIMHPFDLTNLFNFIDKYKTQNVLFYASDIGVMEYAKENNISNLFIYNPETMITNGLDLNLYYDSLKPNAIAMSLEITINDYIHATKSFKGDLFYQIFGRRLMFYSNRKLISLYEDKNKTQYPHDNLYLREATRTDLFPVLENEYGTQIYRGYLLCYLKYLNSLNLKYEFIETLYIDTDKMIEILKIFKEFKNTNDYLKSLESLNLLDLNIKDGFSINDSVYQKEELKL